MLGYADIVLIPVRILRSSHKYQAGYAFILSLLPLPVFEEIMNTLQDPFADVYIVKIANLRLSEMISRIINFTDNII